MLPETAHTLLTASIAGAGLTLTIYSIITPMARRIFSERVNLYRKKKEDFDRIKKKLDEESSEKDFEKLKRLAIEIKEIKMLPRYLNYAALAFIGYIATAIIDFLWLTNTSYYYLSDAVWFLFLFSTLLFLSAGVDVIRDFRSVMKSEYESVKKEVQEVTVITKTLISKFEIRKKEKETESR